MAETLGRIKYIYPAVFILKKLRQIIKTHEHCIKIYDISKGKKKTEGWEPPNLVKQDTAIC